MIGALRRALRGRARFTRLQRERRRYLRSLVERGDDAALAGEEPLSAEMDGDSRTLLIAFGGMNQEVGIPPFEFFSLAEDIPVKRLFVRDLRQAWYHRGLPGHGTTFASVAETLRELIAAHRVERLVLTGNSAGGYAALAFGALLDADAVLAFAPQTILDLKALASMRDHRWDDYLKPLVANDALDARWVDLRPALARAAADAGASERGAGAGGRGAGERGAGGRGAGAGGRGESGGGRPDYRVFFAESLRLDLLHAERLLGTQGLRLYRFGRGDHYLVRALRDCGALKRILQRALGVSAGTQAVASAGTPAADAADGDSQLRPRRRSAG